MLKDLKTYTLLFFVLAYQTVFAQISQVSATYHSGLIMPHTKSIYYYLERPVNGINVSLILDDNLKEKQKVNSIDIFHSSLGNKDVFGTLTGATYSSDFPIYVNNKLRIGSALGMGIGYVSKVFDLEENPQNVAMGAHFNAYVTCRLNLCLKLSHKIRLQSGVQLSHLSNGNFKQPNKGINFSTAYAGLSYVLNENIKKSEESEVTTSKNKIYIYANSGVKEISRTLPGYRTIIGLGSGYLHKVGKSYLGIALNYYYDTSIPDQFENRYEEYDESKNIHHRLAINIPYFWRAGKIVYSCEPGFYLINPHKESKFMSNKMGIAYSISENIEAGIAIKAHLFAIADYIEFGVKYHIIKW